MERKIIKNKQKNMNNERKYKKILWCGKYVKLFEHKFSNVVTVVTHEKVRF
jgi:hypothetical protein